MKTNGHWLISVGELSGDLLGSELIRDLKEHFPHLRFSGIVGPNLMREGVYSIAKMDELNVMGLTELFQKISDISRLKRSILEHVDRMQIKVAILVDFAGFHLQLAEELKMRGVYVIQYVAPKLWAWGEHRVERLKKSTDLVLATFPFEEAYFRNRGVNCYYIGCPIAKRTENIFPMKSKFGIKEEQTLFALLPGSRVQELSRLLRPMLSIAKKVKAILPSAQFIIPVASSLQDPKLRKFFSIPHESYIHFVEGKSLELMAAADAALVASGTATLECALVNTPLAVIYSMNPITYFFAKRNVKIPWASLVNILRRKFVVREFIQDFDEKEVAMELASFVLDAQKKKSVLAEFAILQEDLRTATSLNAVERIHKALQMPYASK